MLDNQHLTGKDAYPTTLPDALKFLQQYKDLGGRKPSAGKPEPSAGVAFVGVGDNRNDADVDCFGCGEKGHRIWRYPKTPASERKAIFEAREAANSTNSKPAAKVGVNNLTSDKLDATSAPAAAKEAPSPTFDQYQGYLRFVQEFQESDMDGLGFCQVGFPESGIALLTPGTHKAFPKESHPDT
ncbi:hypothetical protein ACHAXR_005719 [Thalassiosira sp. AJA248-18]